ncbi:hypothetical protein Bca4012_056261 [Brassica carinata]
MPPSYKLMGNASFLWLYLASIAADRWFDLKSKKKKRRGEIRRLRMVWIMRFSGLFSALLTVIDLSPQTMKDSIGTRLRSFTP